jgi:hypothetical protein
MLIQAREHLSEQKRVGPCEIVCVGLVHSDTSFTTFQLPNKEFPFETKEIPRKPSVDIVGRKNNAVLLHPASLIRPSSQYMLDTQVCPHGHPFKN